MKKTVSILTAFFLAFGILGISLFNSASIKYASGLPNPHPLHNRAEGIDIVYGLPFPGTVSPTSPLWPVKAARDRVALTIKQSPEQQAPELLLLADKRLVMANHLWSLGQEEEALSVFGKSEIYLRQAAEVAEADHLNTNRFDFLLRLNQASLKHRQILEQVLAEGSDVARPRVTEIMNSTKWVYEKTRALLTAEGLSVAPNPFEN